MNALRVIGEDGARGKDWLRARKYHLCLTDTIFKFTICNVLCFLLCNENMLLLIFHDANLVDMDRRQPYGKGAMCDLVTAPYTDQSTYEKIIN